MGSCPGGIANLAVAASRLGIRTGLGTALSADVYGDFCHHILQDQEGIDLSASRRIDDWHSPVTVSLAYGRDRSMITHGHPMPVNPDALVGPLPATRSAFVRIGKERLPWIKRAKEAGARLFTDVGWDETDAWPTEGLEVLDDCYAFLPNAVEAMHYARADTPESALHRLADRVPVAVVTCGADGALAIDSSTGRMVSAPAIPVEALDPTGAGDVFTAGFITGSLREWPMEQSLAFANLVAALSVQHFGGSLSAPGWGDIADWWRAHKTTDLAARYGFLDDVIPRGPSRSTRRATATIARLSDLAN